MTEQPFVSVCIQTFQHKNFIGRCIESALMQQTSFPVEIIIGEDDSTDGTREICREYAARHPDRIRLFLRSEKDKIHIEGKKTGRFNFLSNLHAARGKYVALLDGDDYWIANNKLQKQVDWMEANPAMVISTHLVYWKNKKGETFIPEHIRVADKDCLFSLDDLLAKYFLSMSAIVFQRKYIEDMPSWFREPYFIDYPLAIYIARHGNIGYMNDPMGVYNLHPGGKWSSLKPPENKLTLFRFYSVLAFHFDGKIREAMLWWRQERGQWLVRFYKEHFWFRDSWFRNELKKNVFPDDASLLHELNATRSFIDYKTNLVNVWRLLKSIFKGQQANFDRNA